MHFALRHEDDLFQSSQETCCHQQLRYEGGCLTNNISTQLRSRSASLSLRPKQQTGVTTFRISGSRAFHPFKKQLTHFVSSKHVIDRLNGVNKANTLGVEASS